MNKRLSDKSIKQALNFVKEKIDEYITYFENKR